jgi:hypothetical protein
LEGDVSVALSAQVIRNRKGVAGRSKQQNKAEELQHVCGREFIKKKLKHVMEINPDHWLQPPIDSQPSQFSPNTQPNSEPSDVINIKISKKWHITVPTLAERRPRDSDSYEVSAQRLIDLQDL